MSVALTNEQLDFLARTASWKFDVSVKDERGADDSVVYTGDGVDDLTRLIDYLEGKQIFGSHVSRARVVCDTGRTFSNYVIVTVDDVYALRQKFIDIWGTVAKPAAYYDTVLTPGSKEAIAGGTQGAITPGIAIENPGETPALAPGYPAGVGQMGEFEDFGDGRTPVPPRTQRDQTPTI